MFSEQVLVLAQRGSGCRQLHGCAAEACGYSWVAPPGDLRPILAFLQLGSCKEVRDGADRRHEQLVFDGSAHDLFPCVGGEVSSDLLSRGR